MKADASNLVLLERISSLVAIDREWHVPRYEYGEGDGD